MRPANLPTAAADILAGIALAGGYPFHEVTGFSLLLAALPMLTGCLVSILLYSGGVVLNDVFDARLDAVERPERPIPSGLVSRKSAAVFGAFLLFLGILIAFTISNQTGFIALGLGVGILIYNSLAKQSKYWGPLAMGVIRSLNLWLGFSVISEWIPIYYLGFPLLYIIAITAVSREEVYGATARPGILAGALYAIVILGIGWLSYWETGRIAWPGLFLLSLAVLIYRPLVVMMKERSPLSVRNAVKAGVIGVIIMDAAWAAGYGPWWLPFFIVLLLPVSMVLGKRFSVT